MNASLPIAPRRRAGLEDIVRPIRRELQLVENVLETNLRAGYQQIDALLSSGTSRGGKRLRPILVLLAAKSTGIVNDNHMKLAAVCEMLHLATLVHDDILDGAESRRHLPSINALWGNDAGLLLGDWMFARCYELAASIGIPNVCHEIACAARAVCEGELLQTVRRNEWDITEPQYLQMIEGKTAKLCEVACRLGASLAGGSKQQIRELAVYGRRLGTAFQIADDVLDLVGDDDQAGKTLGTDLATGKATLPIIRFLRQIGETERRAIQIILDGPPDARWSQIGSRLESSGVIDESVALAAQLTSSAIKSIESLRDTDAKKALIALPRLLLQRHST